MRNKLQKFQTFIKLNRNLSQAKILFYTRLLSRQLQNKHKHKIELNINQINVRILPQVFIRFRGQKDDDLHVALADSGSQGNIISLATYLKLGFDKNKIRKCESFNIKSSTETVENAIEGKVQLDLLFLLQSKGSHSNFGKTTVQFLVAGEKVTLVIRLILGVPFLYDNQVKFWAPRMQHKSISANRK